MRRCRNVFLVGWAVLLTSPILGLAGTAAAQTPRTAPTQSFSGSAAAGGVRMILKATGIPGTDMPLDGGGPTAQVAVNSLGTTRGYAAFPDPGPFATSIPGLTTGLLAGGAGGLPPLQLPTLPRYPLYVESGPGTPNTSLGSGPEELSASSLKDSSSARASAGFRDGPLGNAVLALSTASLGPALDGSGLLATATSNIQGITVGPLTIGEITSTASETLGVDGKVTPATDLALAGLRIGGLPVELNRQGFVAGGPTYPVPLNETAAALLKAAGISISFVPPQTAPESGTLVSPAVQLVLPFSTPGAPGAGQYTGTMTLIIGSSTVWMTGAPASMIGTSALPGSIGQGSGAGRSTSPAIGAGVPTGVVPVVDSPAGAVVSSGVVPGGAARSQSDLLRASSQHSTISAAAALDARGLYALMVALGCATGLVGALIRTRRVGS